MENLVQNKKIYILHGWSYTTDKWPPFIAELEKLGFSVKLLHIPGLTSPIDKVWTLDDYVSWLSETLKNETAPVTLLGHSNGGRISIRFASRYPEKVEQLILLDSAGVYHKDVGIKLKRAVFGWLAKIGKVFDGIPEVRRFFYKIIGEKDYRDANPIMRDTMRNLITVDLIPEMQNIKCSTLVIWGERDEVTPLSDGKIIKEKISGAKLEVVLGARHSPHFTNVTDVVAVIRNYYAKTNL